MRTLFAFILVSALALAGGIPSTKTIQGDYIEARTADVVVGSCFANSEVGQMGELAVFGWRVNQGAWQGVNLDGLAVVAAVRASHTLGDVHHTSYPVKAVLIIDEKANLEQRLALRAFAQKMGGDLLQDIAKVHYQPVTLEFENNNVHTMKATLTAGQMASIRTRESNEGDHACKNAELWYQPLTKVNHAMPTFSLANTFKGDGLGVTWSNPDKLSSYVGSFSISAE
jgi:hypothetical protein